MKELERYRSIVDDFSAFCEVSKRPLPLAIWRNSLRVSAGEFAAWFGEWNPQRMDGPRAVSWADLVYTSPSADSIPFVAAYLSGLLHIQEAISMLPVILLDPQPSDRVLDLCAAPGNKTASIAVRMNAGGTVVANDLSRNRLGVVRTTIDRLGLTNVVLTSHDASSYPKAAGMYDRILVDVPCSCEGTSRKHWDVLSRTTDSFRERLINRQKLILERALKLCKPGGRVVYSTCTYAPEECEGVVASVLESTIIGRSFSILRLEVPELMSARGLARWNGVQYPSEMSRAFRVWPHQNDTGGFFAVALHRDEKGSELPVEPLDTAPEIRVASLIPEELEHFRIPPDSLNGYRVHRVSSKYDSIEATSVVAPPQKMCFSRGVRAINRKGKPNRLSTAGALLLGHLAHANRYSVSCPELNAYLSRRRIEARAGEMDHAGVVLVSHCGKTMGRGVIRRFDHSNLVLESHFPRVWAGTQVASRIENIHDIRAVSTPSF